MYGKVFTSIWDGSLYGHLEATATLMALVTLCNAEGVVDMTPEAISGRTGWPLEFIRKGIAELESPDERTRTQGHDGRRLVRLDDNRDWGWLILNYKKYREKKDLDVERQQTRERVRRFRERGTHSNGVTVGNDPVTPSNGSKRQAEAEAEAIRHTERSAPRKPPDPFDPEAFERLRAAFPRREGGQRWPVAKRACVAAIRAGATWSELIAAAERYAAFAQSTGIAGGRFVQQAATFYGEGGGWREAWEVKQKPTFGGGIQ